MVFAVLINDALDPVVVLAQRLIAPPLLQISMQIVLSTYNEKIIEHRGVIKLVRLVTKLVTLVIESMRELVSHDRPNGSVVE